MADDVVVPFGKYKGKLVQETLTDKEYWEYISSQPWFKEKFVNIYNIVSSVGHEAVDTPEHNRIQIMFLDEKFTKAFVKLFPNWSSKWSNDPGVFHRYKLTVKFEVGRAQGRTKGAPVDVCIRPYQSCDFPDSCIWIEVKPSVGDDFPAVLRQTMNSGADVLLIEKYVGTSATFEQVRAFFQTAGKSVVVLEEVLLVMRKDEKE